MDGGNVARALQNLDQFRMVSRDLTRGSLTGGVFTAVAYAAVLVLLVAELAAYMRTSFETWVVMDKNQDASMEINFDISVFDLPCKHLKLGVVDKFGEEKLETANGFMYTALDHKGTSRGRPYNEQEIAALEQADAKTDVTEDEKKDLDADWASSSDNFHHTDFNAAVTFHDFTIVNFFAEWCVHCRKFAPMWNSLAAAHSEKTQYTDGEGASTTVKFLKMNCVAFGEVCREQKIAAFPSIRLYKRTGSFEPYKNKRTPEGILSFIEATVRNSHAIVARHHSIFSEGCRVSGKLMVPRVPGHFYIQAEAFGSENVNPALTNVSHLIHHFSFGDQQAQKAAMKMNVPADMLAHVAPLDGKSFIVERFHEAPQHYLKVVSTHVHNKPQIFYQLTHTERTRKLKRENKEGVAPQARFTWDFSPMSVVVKAKHKPWYEFVTSLFAILGGTYTIVELFSGALGSIGSAVKEAMGKAS